MNNRVLYELNAAQLAIHEIASLYPNAKHLCEAATESIRAALPSLDPPLQVVISTETYQALHDFLEARADVDYDQERWLPNVAMRLMVELERQTGIYWKAKVNV